MVRQAPVVCVMAPPIHLGAWSMALMLWLPFELFITIIPLLIYNPAKPLHKGHVAIMDKMQWSQSVHLRGVVCACMNHTEVFTVVLVFITHTTYTHIPTHAQTHACMCVCMCVYVSVCVSIIMCVCICAGVKSKNGVSEAAGI